MASTAVEMDPTSIESDENDLVAVVVRGTRRGTHQGAFICAKQICANQINVTFTGIWFARLTAASSASGGSASMRLGSCARSAELRRSDTRSLSTHGSANV
jgi:hypothetical protein